MKRYHPRCNALVDNWTLCDEPADTVFCTKHECQDVCGEIGNQHRPHQYSISGNEKSWQDYTELRTNGRRYLYQPTVIDKLGRDLTKYIYIPI